MKVRYTKSPNSSTIHFDSQEQVIKLAGKLASLSARTRRSTASSKPHSLTSGAFTASSVQQATNAGMPVPFVLWTWASVSIGR